MEVRDFDELGCADFRSKLETCCGTWKDSFYVPRPTNKMLFYNIKFKSNLFAFIIGMWSFSDKGSTVISQHISVQPSVVTFFHVR
jgi:hypothetical protein